MRPETQKVLRELEELIHKMRQDAEDWEIGANQGVTSLEAGFALNGWACFLEEFVAKQREEKTVEFPEEGRCRNESSYKEST